MTITLEPGIDCHFDLRVEIPSDFVKTERDRIVASVVQKARIPGYRPGRAPRSIIEKKFDGTIREELAQNLAEKAIQRAAKEKDLKILHVSKCDVKPNEDGSYTLTADLLVAPKFELPEYKGIMVEAPQVEVSEDHVQSAIDDLCRRHADYELLEEGTPLAMGHFAAVTYEAKLDGQAVDVGELAQLRAAFHGEKRMLKMDEEVLFPGFCGELIDKKVGEDVAFQLTVPENFPIESLRGQRVDYTASIASIHKQTIPELNDETAQTIANDPAATAEKLREMIRESLEHRARAFVHRLKAEQVLKYLHEDLNFELPKEMVDHETQQQVNNIVRRSMAQGASSEAIMEHEDKIVDSAGAQAKQEVKQNFIVNEIAAKEKIRVSDAEVLDHIAHLAAEAGVPFKQAVRNVKRNGHVNVIAQQLLGGKVLDFLVANASVRVDESANALDILLEREGPQAIPMEV